MPSRYRTAPAVGVAATLLALTACGSGPNSAPLSTTSGLSASPASVAAGATPAQVLVSGIRGTATLTVADPQIVDVSTPVVNGGAVAFTVTSVAGGATTITVADSTGATVSVAVSSFMCLPPVPNISFLGQTVSIAAPPPIPGGPIPPVTYSTLFFSSPDSPSSNTLIPSYRARLIGSDRSIVQGSPLQPISQVGASTGATPLPVAGGNLEWFSAAPSLPRGVTYRVQLVGRGCEPPFIVGSFST